MEKMNTLIMWGLIFVVIILVTLWVLPERSYAEIGAEMTKRYEGFRAHPYKDTQGNWTIGYGFKITEAQACVLATTGITRERADEVFEEKYAEARKVAREYCGYAVYWKLNQMQRNIITDMAYNLGAVGLGNFKKMHDAIINGDYARASQEMKDSRWYHQVGNRAKHHVARFAEVI